MQNLNLTSAILYANIKHWLSFLMLLVSLFSILFFPADMAELADAHGSGPCERKFMGVQVPLSAPYRVFLQHLRVVRTPDLFILLFPSGSN